MKERRKKIHQMHQTERQRGERKYEKKKTHRRRNNEKNIKQISQRIVANDRNAIHSQIRETGSCAAIAIIKEKLKHVHS